MLKIKLANKADGFANTTYYDIEMIVEKDGEEYEVNTTLAVMQTEEMAYPEYDLTIVDSDIDFSDDELDELRDFAIENYKS